MKTLSLLALLALATAGCAKPIKLVPASGVVEIGGAAAEGIVVQFMPRAAGEVKRPSSFGTSDAEGRFTLVTHEGKPGAVEGDHAVILVDSLEERPTQGQRFTRPPRLDSRYATVAGGLTATVTEGGEPIRIKVPAR